MFVSDGTNSVKAELGDGSVIGVWFDGMEYDADFGAYRPRYAYVIVSAGDSGRHGWRYDGNDLHGGCGSAVDLPDAARSFCSFLAAAADAYAYEMRTGYASENSNLFPIHVTEWAYMHDDEISLLAMEVGDYE